MNTKDVFAEKSTQKHDYTIPKLEEAKRYKACNRDPKTAEKILRQKPFQPKDVHTMRPWADPYNMAPFDLLWETKQIVRTHPQFKFAQCPKPDDPLKEEVMKTRPRLYTSPAVSMDDISDKEIRQLLTDFVYKTTWEQATAEIGLKFNKREIPNCTFEKCVDPVKGNFSIFKAIPTECRKKGKDWETKQYTTLVDPDRQYWISYKHRLNTPVGQDVFLKTVTPETRKEIRDLVEKDELRMAYDKLKPLYAGTVPKNVIGPFRKQELSGKK